MDLVTEYLKLGLRFDRVVDGFVDAYTGDPALQAAGRRRARPRPGRSVPAGGRSCRPRCRTPTSTAARAALPHRPPGRARGGRPPAGRRADVVHRRGGELFPGADRRDRHRGLRGRRIEQISDLIGGSGPLDRAARRRPGRRDLPAGVGRAGGPDRCRRPAGAGHRADRACRPARAHRLRDRPGCRLERLQLLPGRLRLPGRRERRHRPPDEPVRGAGRARVLSRPPHRALPQGGPAGQPGRRRPSTRSSWSTRRSA